VLLFPATPPVDLPDALLDALPDALSDALLVNGDGTGDVPRMLPKV
jgi:hypothetical protein